MAAVHIPGESVYLGEVAKEGSNLDVHQGQRKGPGQLQHCGLTEAAVCPVASLRE